MPFPISIANCINIGLPDQNDARRVIEGVREAVRQEHTKDVTDVEESIIFTGRALFSRTNQLAGIGSGEIRFSQHHREITIYYRLSLLKPLIIAGIAVVCLFVLPSAVMAKKAPRFSEAVGPMGLVWLLYGGAQYLALRFRFPRFLRAAAERALHAPRNSYDCKNA